MDDFQKQLQRLKRNPVFARAFDKRRTEAEVAFQIRRLRESKGWSQKDLAKKVGAASRRYQPSNKLVTNGTLCRYFVASPPS
jgi:ribosome-binding protein aMBF1 (putative translation factor)